VTTVGSPGADTNVPSEQAVREAVDAVGAEVEDDAYGAGWDGDTTHAPSQNAVYDKIETIAAEVEDDAYGAGWDADTTHAPSQNAVYDKVEALDAAKQDALSNPVTSDSATTVENQIPQFTATNNQLKDSLGLVTTVGSPGADTNVPSEQAVREAVDAVGAEVEDDAYGAGWDGDTTHAPSQNAVYDKIEALDTDDVSEGSTNKYVTAANVGAVSDSLDDTDASVEWEDAADLDATGAVNETDLSSLRSGITGIVKGSGDGGGYAAAVAGTDYCSPSSSETLTNKTIDADDNVIQDMPYDIAWSLVDPADADIHYVRLQRAVTLSSIGCIVDPEGTGESVVLDIQECDSNGDNCSSSLSSTITCGNTPTAGTVNDGSWDASDFIKIDIGTVTGTVKTLSIYGVGKESY